MERLDIFQKELNYIKNPKIKNFTEQVLLKLPDYFFYISASSTNKYHSPVCMGDGGLVRHTKMNTTFAADLLYNLEMFNNITNMERDIIISVCILHDGIKHGLGENEYSVATHPLILADFIQNDEELKSLLSLEILEIILGCIKTHMGAFNKDYKTKKEVLPKPTTRIQNFVHLADYLGSRSYIKDFDFDINVIR